MSKKSNRVIELEITLDNLQQMHHTLQHSTLSLYFLSLFRAPSGGWGLREERGKSNISWTKGWEFSGSFNRIIGNGANSRFWGDKWLGNKTLSKEFPRLCCLDTNLEASIANRGAWRGENWEWKWSWSREPRELERRLIGREQEKVGKDKWVWEWDKGGCYSVKGVRERLEGAVVVGGPGTGATLYCPLVPKKLGRLLTHAMLNNKGIDLHTILCPRCGKVTEDADHALVGCAAVKSLWDRMGTWWNKPRSGSNTVSQLIQEDKNLL
ncbi:hypothetical protein OSB04_024494 [Centaurea solstitialis]|uniref:Reverse transcriptase zinc-binding domain-containing protein n=1 Tax=Centaurea solstitialis TaxID=347529 RepID=A0AA38W360_9ASTR|nr:hypothetical protein OSB04_024494 [Centaurea solstitialis]